MAFWREIGDYIQPNRPRFTLTDANRGNRKNRNIIDSTGTMAARTLRAGMMGGVTSPARPWFQLGVQDPDLNEFGPVKKWLYDVTRRMSNVFLRSNIYNILPSQYGDLGTFGTAPILIEEDFDQVIRSYSFPIGSYCLGKDAYGRVNVFHREFRMTVRQVVQKFGQQKQSGQIDWSNISDCVKNLWEKQQYETWIDVCHVIKPNDDWDPSKLHSRFKQFESTYYEKGSETNVLNRGSDQDKFLRQSGYDYFPVLAPRWEVTAEDVYGTDCPGMTALGDVKALQLMQKTKSQGIEKMVKPPMIAPRSLLTSKVSIVPGDITYSDEEAPRGMRPAHEVRISIQELLLDIQDHQKRIQRAYFEDLFLMLANSDRREITAREIDERHEEKLLALGPVLEQLNQDQLDPLIDITYDKMDQQGLIPPPPEELNGMDLKVDYISVLAQAQKLAYLGSVDRFSGFAAQVVNFAPDAIHKIDTDQLLDVYGDITSLPPGIVRTDEEAAAIRQQLAKANQAQLNSEVMAKQTAAVKNLSQSDLSGDSALKRVITG